MFKIEFIVWKYTLAATIPLCHIGEVEKIVGALEYILTADYLI